MNLTYFRGQICEELKGAYDYAKLAMATRATDPAWSKSFKEMSLAELDHADKLFKMAEDYYAGLSKEQQDGSFGKCYRDIVHIYMDDSIKVKYMHQMIDQQPVVVNQPQVATVSATK